MKIISLLPTLDNIDEVISDTVAILSAGGVIVYPTDTVYGLGGNALDVGVIDKVYDIKQRSHTKPLSVVVPHMRWVHELAHVSRIHENVLKSVWPGPVTVVLPQKDIVPDTLTAGTRNIAIRIPDNVFVHTLLRAYGYPLIATSANTATMPESNDIQPVVDMLEKGKRKPDAYIECGTLPDTLPSTILDLSGAKPRITRIGTVKPQELMQLLRM